MRVDFSNVDLKQIKWFVGATEKLLGIQKSEWFVQVLYPKDDLKSLKNVKSYWSSFGLSKEKIKIVKNIKTNEKCGVCILNIYNSSLAESFYYIAEECQELALQSKNNAIRFFRGLSRGDLGIGKTSHQTISFSTESEENAFFFKELCYKIDISTSQPLYDERGKKGYWNVYISHYDNFKRLIKFGCVTHYSRKKNLYNKFLNAKKNHHFNYLCAINSGHNTYRKLIFHMKIAESTSSGALIKYLRRGLITRKHDSSCYTYELSEAGKEELESLQRLNEWLAEKN